MSTPFLPRRLFARGRAGDDGLGETGSIADFAAPWTAVARSIFGFRMANPLEEFGDLRRGLAARREFRSRQTSSEGMHVVNPLVHNDGNGLDLVAGDRNLRLPDHGVTYWRCINGHRRASVREAGQVDAGADRMQIGC